MPSLTKEQVAQLRQYNRQKSTEFLATVSENLEKSYLKNRLRSWGTILGLIGCVSGGINGIALVMGAFPVLAGILLAWSAVLIVIAVLAWQKCTQRMLMTVGVVLLVNSLLSILGGGFIWGPIMFVASIIVIRDARKANRQEKKSVEPTTGASGVPAAQS